MSKEKIKLPEIKISVKFKGKTPENSIVITDSKDVADLCRKIFDADTIEWGEEFILICLNNRNSVLGYFKISSGGMTETTVDVRMLFLAAIQSCATSIIVAHNHPTGFVSPSNEDVKLTKKIKEGGDLLQIRLLDHLIISAGSYYSFSESNRDVTL